MLDDSKLLFWFKIGLSCKFFDFSIYSSLKWIEFCNPVYLSNCSIVIIGMKLFLKFKVDSNLEWFVPDLNILIYDSLIMLADLDIF